MKNTKLKEAGYLIAIAFLVAVVAPARALAHCDGLDGPVVKSARKALETGNVNLVLIWVLKKDEAEVVRAFDKTLAVRKLGGEARELSDTYFFETLVRIHRAGEGEPYTGLKPAGRDLNPALEAADRAIDTGEIAPLADLLNKAMRDQLAEQFKRAARAKNYDKDAVEAGRQFVRAYIEFIHYVERTYDAASRRVEGHYPETEPAKHKHF